MLTHRTNSIFYSLNASPEFGAAYQVIACPVGARASAGSSGSTATVDKGHSFRANDKALIFRPGTAAVNVALTAAVSSVSATSIVWSPETYAIQAGDLLVNLGPDTGTTTPNYDASPMGIYSDPDGGTIISAATVNCDAQGAYGFWHRADGRFWELILDSSAAVAGLVTGHAGVPGRYNVEDFGAKKGVESATRIQATIDAADEFSEGGIFLPASYICNATITTRLNNGGLEISGVNKSQPTGSGIVSNHAGAVLQIESEQIKLRDLYLDANDLSVNALLLTHARRATVDRITCANATAQGVYVNPDASAAAIPSCNKIRFRDCDFISNTGRGLEIANAEAADINNGLLDSCRITSNVAGGILARGAYWTSVAGDYSFNTEGPGLQFGVSGEATKAIVEDWVVTNADIENNNTGGAATGVSLDFGRGRNCIVQTRYDTINSQSIVQSSVQDSSNEMRIVGIDGNVYVYEEGDEANYWVRNYAAGGSSDETMVLNLVASRSRKGVAIEAGRRDTYGSAGSADAFMNLKIAIADTLTNILKATSDGASPQLAFFDGTPVAQAAAYTQTYATAARVNSAALTDSSGGTADGTIAAVSGSGADAAINDNFADVAAEILVLKKLINALVDDLQGYNLAT